MSATWRGLAEGLGPEITLGLTPSARAAARLALAMEPAGSEALLGPCGPGEVLAEANEGEGEVDDPGKEPLAGPDGTEKGERAGVPNVTQELATTTMTAATVPARA
jgi:hypothetical protein